MLLSLLFYFLPVLSLETSVCSILKFFLFSGFIMSIGSFFLLSIFIEIVLNSEIVLVVIVQLYDIIHQANSDYQGHNGTDINPLYEYKFVFQLPFKSCIYGTKLAIGGVNRIRFSCYP